MKSKISQLLLSFLICTSALSIEAVDTAILLDHTYGSSVFWLDDDNLIVAGVPVEREASFPKGWHLLNYSLSGRKITDLGAFGGGLCVSGGFIRYWRPTADTADKPLSVQKKVTVVGPLNNLVEVPPPPPLAPGQEPFKLSPLQQCQFPHELPAPPPWLEAAKKAGRIFRALKSEHGWLEMAIHPRYGIRANPTFPITVHPPGLPDSKGYPVSDVFQKHLGEGFSLWSPEYVPFKDAYFILLDYYQSSRPPGSPLGWWLYPDGRVEEVTFSNPANQTWGNLVFTRAGNLLIRMSFTKSNFHEAGIYLDDVKGPLKLVSGRVQDKAFVSPDGCKVAFGNDTRRDIVPGTERHKLQVIDVCQRISK